MESNTKEKATFDELREKGILFDVGSLYSYLVGLSDRRKRRGLRYLLATVLIIILLAKLSGEDTPYGMADWAQNRTEMLVEALRLAYPKMPHHSTYRRVLEACMDMQELEQVSSQFLTSLPEDGMNIVIAIDGKTLRGTIENGERQGLHLLAAYLPGEGIVLLQMAVEDKENEIVAAPKLLKCLDLRDKVVIGDAMNTQREVSAQIVEAEGEYVWFVKDNQAKTRSAIELLFKPQKPIPGLGCPATDFRSARTVDKHHGRLEERTLTTSSLLNDYLDWPYLAQVFKLERRFTRWVDGKVSHEVSYGITSLSPEEANPRRLLEITRQYWGIENGLHYRRDVTLNEDRTRMTRGNTGHAMAIINNLVLGLFAKHGVQNVARGRRFFNAHFDQALALVTRL